MAHNFEIFKRTSVPLSKDPAVTVQHRGALSLNKSAYAAIGSPKMVELMFDRDEHIIGIRGADPQAAHAYEPYAAKGNEESGPYVVAGKAFMSYFKIEMKETRRFPAVVEDGILLVNLSQAGIKVSGSRSGRTSRNGAAGRG